MGPDRVSNPGPLIYESGALPTALCSPAWSFDLDGLNIFLFPQPLEAIHELWLTGPVAFENMCKTVNMKAFWVEGQIMTLIFCNHKPLCSP